MNSRCSGCFVTLSEKGRRRYEGIEAAKLCHGGIGYVAELFRIDPKAVRCGLIELDLEDDSAPRRARTKRGAQSGDGTATAAGEKTSFGFSLKVKESIGSSGRPYPSTG